MELTLDKVSKSYGGRTVLDIPHYVVHAGELVGLVGNNGAGKTTLFRVVLDLIRPDTGVARIGGIATAHSEEWKDCTGAYIDEGFLIDYLTPEEYFRFVAKLNGISQPQLEERLTAFEHFMNGELLGRNILIRHLSAGNKQKTGIIAAMLHHPQLLILDEPFNFLDPSSQHAIKFLLTDYQRQTGATVIVSSHNLAHTFDIATRITLLDHGTILRDQPKEYPNLEAEINEYFIHQA